MSERTFKWVLVGVTVATDLAILVMYKWSLNKISK